MGTSDVGDVEEVKRSEKNVREKVRFRSGPRKGRCRVSAFRVNRAVGGGGCQLVTGSGG